jgi:hypothetical protein
MDRTRWRAEILPTREPEERLTVRKTSPPVKSTDAGARAQTEEKRESSFPPEIQFALFSYSRDFPLVDQLSFPPELQLTL